MKNILWAMQPGLLTTKWHMCGVPYNHWQPRTEVCPAKKLGKKHKDCAAQRIKDAQRLGATLPMYLKTTQAKQTGLVISALSAF